MKSVVYFYREDLFMTIPSMFLASSWVTMILAGCPGRYLERKNYK